MTGKRFMPVPGDVVIARLLEDEGAVVETIQPRSFSLQRRTAEGRSKTMAANVDLLIAVIALAHPAPRAVTLDQLLAFAELEGIDAAITFTKPDLVEGDGSRALPDVYRALGYQTIVANPKLRENVEPLRELAGAHRAMLAGNSGVGKSAIFRALGGEGAEGTLSRFGMGKQTTTAARLFRVGNGFLIDSPGLNEFGLGRIEASELVRGFREMTLPAQACRFADCRHLREPDCGVLAAVADGRIAESRYGSYAKILEDAARTAPRWTPPQGG